MTRIKTQAVVFDQGYTLIFDPFDRVMESQREEFRRVLIRHYNNSIKVDELVDAWRDSNNTVNYPYAGHFMQEEPIIQDALRDLGISDTCAAIIAPKLLLKYRIGLRRVVQKDPRNTQVRYLLEHLKAKGKRLGVFSNDRIIGLGMNMGFMGIDRYFDYFKTSEELGAEKPDTRVFADISLYFKNKFNISKDKITYVGDDPVNDVDPPKRAGFNAVLFCVDDIKPRNNWVGHSSTKTLYKPDAKISELSELLDAIE